MEKVEKTLTKKEARQCGLRWSNLAEVQRKVIAGHVTQIKGATDLLNNKELMVQLGDEAAVIHRIITLYNNDFEWFMGEMDAIHVQFKGFDSKVTTPEHATLHDKLLLEINTHNIHMLALTGPHMAKLTEIVYLNAVRMVNESGENIDASLVSELESANIETKDAIGMVANLNSTFKVLTEDAGVSTSLAEDIIALTDSTGKDMPPKVEPINEGKETGNGE